MLIRELGWPLWVSIQRIRRHLRPERYDWSAQQVAFIVSTGRTGTKFLAKLLCSAFERVDARHEPSPDLFVTGTRFARGEIGLGDAIAGVVNARLQICAQVHRSENDYYIEANNNLAYLIPAVRRVFPKAPIVHIVRDGRDFVRSSYSKIVRAKGFGRKEALFMSDQDARLRLQAEDLVDDPYRERWPQMSRFERMCWYWSTKDQMIRNVLQGDSRSMVVKFEDIFDPRRDHAGLWKMADFLGISSRLSVAEDQVLEMMKSRENVTRRHQLPSWGEWSGTQMQQFRAIAGEQMIWAGYEL